MNTKLKKVFIFLMLFFLFKPTGLDYYFPKINSILNILKLFSMIFILVIYISYIIKKKAKINRFIFMMLSLEIITIIVCLINSISPYNSIVYWQSIISVIMAFDCFEKDKKLLIDTSRNIFIIYILFNILFAIINPDCIINQQFVLGKKNMPILYVFPLLFFEFYSIIKKEKTNLFSFLVIISCYISILITHSSTSIVACFISLLIPISMFSKPICKIISSISAKTILIFSLILFILIVEFKIQQLFSDIILVVFNKDMTFTGRTNVWDTVIQYIKLNPFGYGWDHNIIGVKSVLVWENEIEISHAHNFLLNLAFKSGIICSAIYLYLLYIISKAIDECKKISLNTLFKVTFLIFLIITTFESYTTNCIGIIYILYIMYSENNKLENGESK